SVVTDENEELVHTDFDCWAIDKLIILRTCRKDALFRVFRSIWYTTSKTFDRSLFAMTDYVERLPNDGYKFTLVLFWIRFYKVPLT
ncbi:hypothetical protein Golax_018233, partial [Gossypium laxum]|nr:hypothetical protein [Gossypium laxum]